MNRAKRIGIALLAAVALGATACAIAQTQVQAQDEPRGDAGNGKRIYLTVGCFTCHGRSGQGGAYNGPAPILASTAFGYLTVVMSYLSPDRIFAFLVNSYGTVAIFVYVLIAVAELKLRRRLEREAPARLRVRMWGYPWLTRLTIAAMLAIVAAMAVIPEQRVALLFGLVSVAVLLIAYALRLRFPVRRQGAFQ